MTDKPFPRGEIYIGGDNVARGYFKLDEKTEEDFFTDENNRRWFRTGDIGQVEEDGTLRIVDRKKDIVKLQNGEYVSLGKVENILEGCPVVANICVFGNIAKDFVVALICPNAKILNDLSKSTRKEKKMSLEKLCEDHGITELIQKSIAKHGRVGGLRSSIL